MLIGKASLWKTISFGSPGAQVLQARRVAAILEAACCVDHAALEV